MSHPLPRATRRAALGLGAGLGLAGGVSVLTGCSATGTPDPAEPGPTRAPNRTSTGAGAGAESGAAEGDPDTTLVALVVDEVSLAHARVRANRRAHRGLAQQLRGLERLHARHAAELGGLVPVEAKDAAAVRRRQQVVSRIATGEDQLQERLVAHSLVAESGALALLLAAMAAGVAQERSRL